MDPPLSAAQRRDAFRFAEAVAADVASASNWGMLFSRYASQLGLSDRACENSGPGYSIRKVSEAAGSVEQVAQFASAGAKLNILRNFDASF